MVFVAYVLLGLIVVILGYTAIRAIDYYFFRKEEQTKAVYKAGLISCVGDEATRLSDATIKKMNDYILELPKMIVNSFKEMDEEP